MQTGSELLSRYLTREMALYFRKKLADDEDSWRETKISELLKYLYLASISDDGGPILFSQEVDDVWHFWILQTADYRRLCAALPGGKFLDHSSVDFPATGTAFDEIPSSALQNRALQYFCNYHVHFGAFTDAAARAWPTLGLLRPMCGPQIAAINSFLRMKVERFRGRQLELVTA